MQFGREAGLGLGLGCSERNFGNCVLQRKVSVVRCIATAQNLVRSTFSPLLSLCDELGVSQTPCYNHIKDEIRASLRCAIYLPWILFFRFHYFIKCHGVDF